MKITKDNNEALYIFSWNDAEIIEKHTQETFIKKYGNIKDLKCFCKFKDMNELFDDGLAINEVVIIDNMLVIRI